MYGFRMKEDILVSRSMNAPTEIPNLKLPVQTNEQIFWLDVTVHDMFAVKIAESIDHLVDVL